VTLLVSTQLKEKGRVMKLFKIAAPLEFYSYSPK
jgi:hypothetical protein